VGPAKVRRMRLLTSTRYTPFSSQKLAMRRSQASALLLVALWALACACASAQVLQVSTSNGPVVGQLAPGNASVRTFIGVPYAAPPVGSLRWAPPSPPAAWTSPLAAQYPPAGSPVLGVSCPQGLESLGIYALDPSDAGQSFVFTDGLVSEDCLYLNVWTPCADASCSLPVIVFLHGGAWVTGTAMDLSLDGTAFAAAGAVFISLNYRLGALGNMASELQPASALNVGFQDQQAALAWVQANAQRFGGDPSRVMLTGQSAGSEAVSAHLLSPGSAGLFRRALMESCSVLFTPGPISDYVKPLPAARAAAASFLAQLGCAGDLACARALPWWEVINAQENLHYASLGGTADQAAFGPAPYNTQGVYGAYPYWSFELVADGVFVPAHPAANATSGVGLHAGVDLVAGFNANEGALFVDGTWTAANFAAMIDAYFPSPAAACAAAGMLARFNGSAHGGVASDAYADAYASMCIKCPTRTLLQGMYAHAPGPAPANLYLYVYTHADATHGAELPFLFGNDLGSSFTASEVTLGGAMRAAWVAFAATGAPGLGWPKWDAVSEKYLVLDTTAFPDSSTPRFATAQLPKSTCQYMEVTPSTPTCGVLPPAPPAPSAGGSLRARLLAAVLGAALLLC
jgi:para-nitrobenzyl esterase